MREFARCAEAIASTASKLEKTRLLAEYLRTLEPDDLRLATTWMTGRPFSLNDPRTLQVGGASLWRAVEMITRAERDELSRVYRKHSDPGDWVQEVLAGKTEPVPATPAEVAAAFAAIAGASGSTARQELLGELLRRLDPREARFVVKILANDLRIGLQEGLVEEAVALAFDLPLATVKRVHMLTGDLGEAAVRARAGETGAASMELFRPIRFMLAGVVADAAEAMQRVGEGAWTEEKYDGVRCQLHRGGGRVALYSRDLKETTAAFPEVAGAAAELGHEVLIDGEILAHRQGRVLRFFELQRRLGRKVVSAAMREEVPVVLVAFDLLLLDGEVLLDRPLRERRRLLEGLRLEHPFLLARIETATGAEDLDRIFGETRERGNEGLMLKNPESAYTPGRRGLSWLKLKRPLATLDCVVTAVEWGHGKRRGVLSDYTFAVRDEAADRLVNVGKAYTGLTDAEIATMTQHFQEHTILDRGRVRVVEPETVVEVAFDSIQRSTRHKSGFALRFPRIVRLRDDKGVRDVDTLASVEQLYQRFFGGAESETRLEEVAEAGA
ncbi:MAG TPA: ATP-dependent DNA ligase [Candidatus Dormibacteraeota bacterium]|nr:ATP-dependent DNA ligase [Candidatus Dormibacteraeota bacterium]